MHQESRVPSPWLIPFAILALALGLATSGCGGAGGDGTAEAASQESGETTSEGDEKAEEKDEESEEDEEKEKPVPVEVAGLGRGEIQATIRSTTNLEAERQVKVFSQATRLVRERYVEEGDRVEKDWVLLRLQDDEQRSALAKVQSQYEKAHREYLRQEELHEKQLISDEVFSNATYEVEQLRIALEDAQRELSYTEVRAPIAGTITTRHVNIGDNLTVGQHLFDLVDFNSIVARIYVPEKELPRLAVGQTAWVEVQGGSDRKHGTVERISPIVDPQTGTVKVTIAFDGSQRLRPGMYVDVDLITEVHRDALLIPTRALVYDQDQVFVFRLGDERRVKRLLVDLVLEDEEYVMPSQGFEVGDEIVVAGQAGLKDDALVRLPGDPDAEEEEEKTDEDETQVATRESR